MNKRLIFIFLSFCIIGHSMVMSASVSLKDAYKAVFNVITYNEDGTIINSGYGCFISEDGTGVAAFGLFKNAVRADVIDFKGKKMSVARISGASSTYDLIKFRVDTEKKTEYFPLSSDSVGEGEVLRLVNYTANKKNAVREVSIAEADNFQQFKYYQLSTGNEEKNWGCPLIDAEGRLVAIVQKNVEKDATQACAIDARFVGMLAVTATGAINADLRAVRIPKSLPESGQDARTYIFMLGNSDSLQVLTAHNDFISRFPEEAEGYVNRAFFYADRHLDELAAQDMEKALEVSTGETSVMKADGVHYSYSKLMYNNVMRGETSPRWTLEQAGEEARRAFERNQTPLYLMQEGHCLFAGKRYQDAYERYLAAATSVSDQTAGVFVVEGYYAAARSLNLAGGDSLKVLELMDSVIVHLEKPYTKEASIYFQERARLRVKAGQYRAAVLDYNEYEKIIGPKNLTDRFYFLREQAELQSHMYQQALDDIRSAMRIRPENVYYQIEEALILLQVGHYEEVIAASEKILNILPENPDCYKIMGIAFGELKQKDKAVAYLKKALELGDDSVEGFMKKYQ